MSRLSLLSSVAIASMATIPVHAQEFGPVEAERMLATIAENLNARFTLRSRRVEDGAVVADGFKWIIEDDDAGLITYSGGALALRPDAGDYDVVFDWPERSTVRIDSDGAEFESMIVALDMAGMDYRMRLPADAVTDAGGLPDAVDYLFDADSAVIRLETITADDAEVPVAIDFEYQIDGLASEGSWARSGDQDGRMTIARIFGRGGAGDGANYSNGEGETLDVSLSYELAGPMLRGETDDLSVEDTIRVSAQMGAAQASSEVVGPQIGLSYDTTSTGTVFDLALDEGAFAMNFGITGLEVSGAADMLPFPEMGGRMERLALALAMPLLPAEGGQDYATRVTIEALELDDTVWSLFDAGGALPRDPAFLDVQVSGLAEIIRDLFEDQGMAELEPPLMPLTLELERLMVDAVGFMGGAEGSFTFEGDASDPIPVGQAEVRISGINALMENLMATGLIDNSALVPVRMMLGVFAQPVGEDSYVSEIEAGADGVITANGVPFQ